MQNLSPTFAMITKSLLFIKLVNQFHPAIILSQVNFWGMSISKNSPRFLRRKKSFKNLFLKIIIVGIWEREDKKQSKQDIKDFIFSVKKEWKWIFEAIWNVEHELGIEESWRTNQWAKTFGFAGQENVGSCVYS